MRLRAVRTMLRKELTDTLRDRRTLVATVVLPLLLYPLIFVFMGAVVTSTVERAEAEQPIIAIWGAVPDEVIEALEASVDPRLDFQAALPVDPEEEARRVLATSDVHLVLSAGEGSDPSTIELTMYSHQVESVSRAARSRTAAALDELGEALLEQRLTEQGLDAGFVRPLEVTERDVATAQQRGGDIAGRLIPLILLIMVAIGASFAAIDVTAGEKERGTMQTLLVAPVRPLELVTAKYLTVLVIALASAVLNLLGMSLAIGRQAASLAALEGVDIGFSLDISMAARVLALLVPTAMLVAALLMAVTVFARTFREAQTYAQPVFIVVLVAGLAAITDLETGPTTALVPLMGVVMVVRDVLRDAVAPSLVVIAFGANLLYAFGAVAFAARIFSSEQVLLGGERPWRDVWSRRRPRRPTPTGRAAVGFAVALVVLTFYGAGVAVGLDFVGQLLFTQVGILLLPAILFVSLGRFDPRQTLWLRWPQRRHVLGVLLVAAGTWSVGSAVALGLSALFGGGSYFDTLGEHLVAETATLGVLATVLLLAVLPALSEEICFRGVILSGLRSTGSAVGAVAGSSLLFGLFHVAPFHIVPAAAIGAVLATGILLTRSLVVGVLGHAATNGVAVAAIHRAELLERFDHPVTLVGGLLCVGIGLAVLARGRAGTDATR